MPGQAAAFVDAENHMDLDVAVLMRRLSGLDIAERHAYADWRDWRLSRLAEHLGREGFDMHHTWSGDCAGAHKNRADHQMSQDIMRVLERRPEIQVSVLVSGDAFFVPTVQQLRDRGRRVMMVADPFRTSEELRGLADAYLPIGRLERWVRGLDYLERTSKYLTFRFALQKLDVGRFALAEMIRRGLVVQENVHRPQRGTRPEIRLNRESVLVQAVLGS